MSAALPVCEIAFLNHGWKKFKSNFLEAEEVKVSNAVFSPTTALVRRNVLHGPHKALYVESLANPGHQKLGR